MHLIYRKVKKIAAWQAKAAINEWMIS